MPPGETRDRQHESVTIPKCFFDMIYYMEMENASDFTIGILTGEWGFARAEPCIWSIADGADRSRTD